MASSVSRIPVLASVSGVCTLHGLSPWRVLAVEPALSPVDLQLPEVGGAVSSAFVH